MKLDKIKRWIFLYLDSLTFFDIVCWIVVLSAILYFLSRWISSLLGPPS